MKFPSISKKNTNKIPEKKNIANLYVQASAPSTSKILKIKKAFSKLQTSKINIFTKLLVNLGN